MVLTNFEGLSLGQKKALAIIPHVTGTFSLLGSSFILFHIFWISRGHTLPQPYSRLIACISLFDVLSSAALALSTWPIPRGTEGVYAAVGTPQTCTAQGFFGQLLLGSPFYNMMLAVYYLLVGKYNLPKEIVTGRYEPFMHLIGMVPTLALAIAGIPLNVYHNANIWCGVALAPNADAKDERINRFFNLVPAVIMWLIIATVTVAMIMLTISIRTEEKRFIESKRKRDAESQESEICRDAPLDLQRSRKMFRQAAFYVGAFYMTWWAPWTNRIVTLATGKSYFFLVLATVTFLPLQGFFNFMVYCHGPCIA